MIFQKFMIHAYALFRFVGMATVYFKIYKIVNTNDVFESKHVKRISKDTKVMPQSGSTVNTMYQTKEMRETDARIKK